MTKKACDNCEKQIKDNDDFIATNVFVKESTYIGMLHFCMKCINDIPVFIKERIEEHK